METHTRLYCGSQAHVGTRMDMHKQTNTYTHTQTHIPHSTHTAVLLQIAKRLLTCAHGHACTDTHARTHTVIILISSSNLLAIQTSMLTSFLSKTMPLSAYRPPPPPTLPAPTPPSIVCCSFPAHQVWILIGSHRQSVCVAASRPGFPSPDVRGLSHTAAARRLPQGDPQTCVDGCS